MLETTHNISPIEQVIKDNKNLSPNELFDLVVEYYTEFYKFGLYSAGVIAIGVMKENGIDVPFLV